MQEAMSVDDRSFEQKVEEELALVKRGEENKQLEKVNLRKYAMSVVEQREEELALAPAALITDKPPYCKRHGNTAVLWHTRGETNFTDDSCELRGCCYQCIREGEKKRAYYPGKEPPRAYKIKCTDAFHDYLYWVDLSDDDFLRHRKPSQITEKEANFLSKQVPEYEKKGEAIYLFP